MKSTAHRLGLVLAGSLVACQHRSIGVGPYPEEIFGHVQDSPLLLDLGAPDPEVEVAPIPELRIAGDERFDLDLGQASLGEAIHLIAERAGVNIYLDEDLGETVHASFPSVTLDDARFKRCYPATVCGWCRGLGTSIGSNVRTGPSRF